MCEAVLHVRGIPGLVSLLVFSYHEQAVNILISLEVCKLRRGGLVSLNVCKKLKVPDMLVSSLLEGLDAFLVGQQRLKRPDCSLKSELMALTKAACKHQQSVLASAGLRLSLLASARLQQSTS